MSDNNGLKVILKDDETTELTFSVYLSGKPETAKSATLKLVRILKGFWLNENNEELTQTDGLNKNVVYGQKVKIKLITSHTTDGDIVEVEIKAKKGDEYVELGESEKEKLKFELKVKNNEAISESFYLNPKWYNEEKENYNYDTHQTEIDPEELLTFVFDAKYKGQDVEHGRKNLPKEVDKKLKPISYRRNYEELIGLFKTDNIGEKHKENNYENKFINNNSKIKSIVDEFTEKVIEEDITISDIETLVEKQATKLWNSAVKQVQSGNLDDRPLYWARNKMQTWLKRNPLFKDQIDFEKSIVKKSSELEKIIILFEEKSRNYTGIDFSKAGSKKKVLVTGFDPFLLNSINHPDKKYYNILQSNPSGVVASYLSKNSELDAYIETMIVPVRYSDFDGSNKYDEGIGEGIIEKYIQPFINEADMIITISQKLEGDYDIDAFATIRRGGGDENMNHKRPQLSKSIASSIEWIETTLPKNAFIKNSNVEIDDDYEIVDFENRKLIKKEGLPDSINDVVFNGPGGNYLSNEIFYRVARLRKEISPELPTGHFHINKIQDESVGEDLKQTEIKEVIKIVKDSIYEAIKSIK